MVRALQETEIKSSFIKYPGSIALAFTIGLLVVFFWVGAFHYEVNDDVGITALVKGLFGFKASPNGIFISLLLGNGLFSLYEYFPLISWFSL